ncbi:MAG TPA: two-component regulator propeller domain-containing protein, partial [Bacteroidales bacterium]|nr:two-component regulator propeller domain-containing protein [Bacteroidales bacterium]
MPYIVIKRPYVFVLLAFTWLFLVTLHLNGQYKKENIKFYNVSIKNGLSQSSANCIFQDSQGIIWIGTEDGLNKYDGYVFKVYKPLQDDPYSISGSRILAIGEDKNQNLWIGTNGGGLNLYDKKSDKFSKIMHASGPGASIINTILVYNEQIWVGTNKGLAMADPDTRQYRDIIEFYPELKPMLKIPVKTMIAEGNTIWIGTTEGLFRFNIERKELNRYTDFGNVNARIGVTALLADRYQNLVIGTETNLYKMDKQTGIINIVDLPGLSTSIKALVEDNEGNLWIGTFGNGLYIGLIQAGQFNNFLYDHLNPYSIRNNEVLSLFRDHAGLIWTGTNGIDIYNPLKEKFILYDYVPYSREKLVFRNIHPIYEDIKEVLWIGSKTDGVHILDRSNKKYSHLNQSSGISSNRVRAITEYPEGTIWIGTEDAGFDVVQLNGDRSPARIKNYRSSDALNSVNSNTIYTFYPDGKGNMWIGTDKGLAVMDIESETFKRYLPDSAVSNSISNSTVYKIFGDRNGSIWLATDLGVNKYDESADGFIHFIHDDQNENSII